MLNHNIILYFNPKPDSNPNPNPRKAAIKKQVSQQEKVY